MKLHRNAADALSAISSGQRLFVHGAAATPLRLIDALVAQATRLRDIELVHLHTQGTAAYASPEHRLSFRVKAFFVGPNLRGRVDRDGVDYIPCLLSEIPGLIRSREVPIDVALIQVSPPDRSGHCSLGTSTDIARAAVDSARVVIAQINPRMPRVHGDGFVHVSRLDHAIEVDELLPQDAPLPPTPEESAIGDRVARLIEDGSTLQMGIGAIPNAVMGALKGHRHLGIHTEMWSDGALELIKAGVVDNSLKTIYPGRTVAAFVTGSQALYDFVHDNPSTIGLDVGYVNHPFNIARNPKVVAINSAVEIDLTGQVCADSIGSRIISGAGGQLDFMRGAALSPGGKPIIALTSRARRGQARIVASLREGAGVVTPRSETQYVVTEHGAVNLRGKSLDQRARALIALAHPDDREALARAWREKK